MKKLVFLSISILLFVLSIVIPFFENNVFSSLKYQAIYIVSKVTFILPLIFFAIYFYIKEEDQVFQSLILFFMAFVELIPLTIRFCFEWSFPLLYSISIYIVGVIIVVLLIGVTFTKKKE